MDNSMDSPGHSMGLGTNTKDSTQSADPFGDPMVLGIASVLLLVSLVGTIISCVCCFKRRSGNHHRYRNSSSSGSLRDTVQLQDLLSKPSLADPESVFSEFLIDARISDDASTTQTSAAVDEIKLNSGKSSRSSSLVEANEDLPKTAMEKKGSKNYKKESKKRSLASLNNNNSSSNTSIYKKNSSSNQTLQNDLAYVSSKRKKVENKLEHYEKKATGILQQQQQQQPQLQEEDSNVKVEKVLNVDKDLEKIDTMVAVQQPAQQRKSSLEVLDTRRYSSGSEDVSFNSSARGSFCHDLGVPANTFRQQRPSIYPRMDLGSRYEGRRDGAEDDVCSLPYVLESPVLDYPDDVAMHIEDETGYEIEITEDSKPPSCEELKENTDDESQTGCCKDQNRNVTRPPTCQNDDPKECRIRNKRKCLQASYSVDAAFKDQLQHQREKLPERISLNLQIDFHFSNQGQSHGEGLIPIVVCSPIAFNNESQVQDTNLPRSLSTTNPERDNSTSCCKSTQPDNKNEQQEIALKIHNSSQTASIPNTSNTHDGSVAKEKAHTEYADTMRTKSSTLQMTTKIPYWVKNRLSEPVEFYQWMEKISKSPRLKKRSFTIADFKSLKFRSFTNVYNDTNEDKLSNPQEKAKEICPNSEDTYIEPSGISYAATSTADISSNESGEQIGGSKSTCESKDDTNDKITIEDAILKSTPPETDVGSETAGCPDQTSDDIVNGENSRLNKETLMTDHNMPKGSVVPTPDDAENEKAVNQTENNNSPGSNTIRERIREERENQEGVEIEKNENKSDNQMTQQTDHELKEVVDNEVKEVTANKVNKMADKEVNEVAESEIHQSIQEPDITAQRDESSVVEQPKLVKTRSCDNVESYNQDDSRPEEENQSVHRSSMIRSNSLGFIPVIPFVPPLVVTSTDGIETGMSQTFPKSTLQSAAMDGSPANNNVNEIDCSQTGGGSLPKKVTGTDRMITRDDKDDDRISDAITDDDFVESGKSETYPKPMRQKASSTCNVMESDPTEVVSYRQSCSKSTRRPRAMMIGDATIENDVTEIGSSQTFPKSISQKRKSDANTTMEHCVSEDASSSSSNQTFPRLTQQKSRSADTTMDGDNMEAVCSQTFPRPTPQEKPNSANTTIDTNAGSDDSDYDNPWDSLENAVKRASMKCHKRPSMAASSVRDLMLKSAEDLGRLIEMAEARRKNRLNSTKSTCDDLDNESNIPPVFTRASPLRHTVKGVMSRSSNEELRPFGSKPHRGKVGSKSLRVSKDDSVHNMNAADDSSKASSKPRKFFYSPESKKKVKKGGH